LWNKIRLIHETILFIDIYHSGILHVMLSLINYVQTNSDTRRLSTRGLIDSKSLQCRYLGVSSTRQYFLHTKNFWDL